MRKRVRRILRLLALIKACLGTLSAVYIDKARNLVGGSIIRPDSRVSDGMPDHSDKRKEFILQRLSKQILAILGITVTASPTVSDTGNRLLLSNHLSYLDVLVIGSFYRTRFVAKSEVAEWPLIGSLVSMAGTLFLRRGVVQSSVSCVYQVSQYLRSAQQVHVFPEGTTTNGKEKIVLHPLFLAAAVRSQRSIAPLALRVEEVREDGKLISDPEELIAWYADANFVTHFWRLLLIDSARIHLVELEEIKVSRADRPIGLANQAEELINSTLTSEADFERKGEVVVPELLFDLLFGALLFSHFVNPGNQIAREAIPQIEEIV